MKIGIQKFGEILTSRPAGREAMLVMKAYFQPKDDQEKLELDFTGVRVVTPSWLDEVMTGLQQQYGNRVIVLPSNNPSLKVSLGFSGTSSNIPD